MFLVTKIRSCVDIRKFDTHVLAVEKGRVAGIKELSALLPAQKVELLVFAGWHVFGANNLSSHFTTLVSRVIADVVFQACRVSLLVGLGHYCFVVTKSFAQRLHEFRAPECSVTWEEMQLLIQPSKNLVTV